MTLYQMIKSMSSNYDVIMGYISQSSLHWMYTLLALCLIAVCRHVSAMHQDYSGKLFRLLYLFKNIL